MKIRGGRDIGRKTRRITAELEQAAKAAVIDTALAIEGDAKRKAPVDTGRLRNSITHERSDDELSARVGTNVEYAPYQEFGTVRMNAQPFLHPAAEGQRNQFKRRLRENLRRAVRRGAS